MKIKKTKFRKWLLGKCQGNFDTQPCQEFFQFCKNKTDGYCVGMRRYKLVSWLFRRKLKQLQKQLTDFDCRDVGESN